MRRLTALALAGALALGACSTQEPLAGIDLPPASLPVDFEGGGWAITFTRDFPPGFWTEGSHVYTMALVCDPILDQPMRTDPVFLDASSSEEVSAEPVYVRLVGLSHLLLGPRTLNAINPAQPTTAALTVLGISSDGAQKARSSCAGAFFADGGDPMPLLPQEPFRQ